MPVTTHPATTPKPKALKDYTVFQRYFIEEFYDDFREGSLSRRSFIRRLAYIAGSITAGSKRLA
jgi:hypothetical protein